MMLIKYDGEEAILVVGNTNHEKDYRPIIVLESNGGMIEISISTDRLLELGKQAQTLKDAGYAD